MGASTHLKIISDVRGAQDQTARNKPYAKGWARNLRFGERDPDHWQYETVRKIQRVGRLADLDK
jgi:hypothetical protein